MLRSSIETIGSTFVVKDGFETTPKGLGIEIFLEVTTIVEEWLIDPIEAVYWLYHFWKKFNLDLWKYFPGVVDGFESNSKGLKIGFGSHLRGWKEADWFQKD